MNQDVMDSVAKVAVFFPIFLFAICFHEFSHALFALWRGDRTAQMMGRLTLNPFAHADLLGTVIFPIMGVLTGFFFGWAKPVPINPRNLKNPKVDLFWIALAGPLSNLFLGLVMAIILGFSNKFFYGAPLQHTVTELGKMFIMTNLSLAVFNALPFHPLDGGKIIARFLPPEVDNWLEQNQFFLFIALMLMLNSGMRVFFIMPIQFLYMQLMKIASVIWMM